MIFGNKINISLLLFAILSLILIAVLIFPLYRKIINDSHDFLSTKEKIVFQKNKIANIEDFKQTYLQTKENLEKIDSIFVDAKIPIKFIGFLEDTAKSCNLAIKISSASQQKPKGDLWTSLFFQINSVGSFPDTYRFLEKLDNAPYMIDFQNLNISRLSETDLALQENQGRPANDIKANFLIKVFAK